MSWLTGQGMRTRLLPPDTDWLQVLPQSHVDLVFLGVSEPGLQGLRFLQQLRLADPTVPVIVLSTRASTSDLVTALAVGAEDYLPWPCPLPELLARSRAVLRRTAPAPPPTTSGLS